MKDSFTSDTKDVITVRGEIRPSRLGFCQSHEHLFIAYSPAAEQDRALLINDVEKSTLEAASYARAGGSAVVDAQPLFTGRDARALKRISEETGVHVIASTGFHKLYYYGSDNLLPYMGEEELADIFTEEIMSGMFEDTLFTDKPARTDIRAGQIKAALEPEFTNTHRRLFTGAAGASVRTGAPVMIHVDKGADPLALLEFLEREGVAPEKQIYCHLDRAAADISIHYSLAEAGAYIEYDTIARPKYHSDEAEACLILSMLDAGFADRLLMSLDVTRERQKAYGGTPGLDYILRIFIPWLESRGAAREAVKKLFVDNPAEVFAI